MNPSYHGDKNIIKKYIRNPEDKYSETDGAGGGERQRRRREPGWASRERTLFADEAGRSRKEGKTNKLKERKQI